MRPLTAAMFPGTHCPLMGAAMAVRGISDALMLIIGTDECTYYTKHFSVHGGKLRRPARPLRVRRPWMGTT